MGAWASIRRVMPETGLLILALATVVAATLLNLASGAAFEQFSLRAVPNDKRSGPVEVSSSITMEWSWGTPIAVIEIGIQNASSEPLSGLRIIAFASSGLRLDEECFEPHGGGPMCSPSEPEKKIPLPTRLAPGESLRVAGTARFQEDVDFASGRFELEWLTPGAAAKPTKDDFSLPRVPALGSSRALLRTSYVVLKDVALVLAIMALPLVYGRAVERRALEEAEWRRKEAEREAERTQEEAEREAERRRKEAEVERNRRQELSEVEALNRLLLPGFDRKWRRFYAPVAGYCKGLLAAETSPLPVVGWAGHEKPQGLRELCLYLQLEGLVDRSMEALGGWSLRTFEGESLADQVWGTFVGVGDAWLQPRDHLYPAYLRLRRLLGKYEYPLGYLDCVQAIVDAARTAEVPKSAGPQVEDLTLLLARFSLWQQASFRRDCQLLSFLSRVLLHEWNLAVARWYGSENPRMSDQIIRLIEELRPAEMALVEGAEERARWQAAIRSVVANLVRYLAERGGFSGQDLAKVTALVAVWDKQEQAS